MAGKNKPYHIVFTTINHPILLNSLYDNVKTFHHLEEVKVWIIGDRKTPASCGDIARETSAKGLECIYLSIEDQDKWGERCQAFYQRIPYNNETRRNIGYLCALEDGCQVMISIDDDNYPTERDFVGGHSNTGSAWHSDLISESNGFHNICEYIEIIPKRTIFPRGYPFKLRGQSNAPNLVLADTELTIGVTAGLWLSDPDIDATTWLNGKVTGIKYCGEPVQVLNSDTWSPINTQNTSIIRDLIPAFLCIPMGWAVPGGSIQRYGDIWGGYFLQAIMKGSKYLAAFGDPIADHRRNPHDYVDDLRYEFWGMILSDWLLDKLKNDFQPSASKIVDRVDDLADFLASEAVPSLPEWCPGEVEAFIRWTEGNLRAWAEACRLFI